MSAPTPAEAQALLTALTRALTGVAVMTLVFTAVNVTLFATRRGVPWPIALLLDPMVALALSAVLYADARLAAWNLPPPGWSTALRWFTGITATLMNTWESIWPTAPADSPTDRPTGLLGWPTTPDPAGILLHGIPTVLLVLLTETTAAYRRTITPLLTTPTDPGGQQVAADRPPAGPDRPSRHEEPPPPSAPLPGPHPADTPPPPSVSGPPTAPGQTGAPADGTGPLAPRHAPGVDRGRPGGDGPTNADLWARARTLDTAARARTGRPVSVWRLRTDLRIGAARAEQIRTRLLADPPTGRRSLDQP